MPLMSNVRHHMKPDIWGVFHDGVIKRIAGKVPGAVQLEIEIHYLRGMFGGEGTSFKVHLAGCTLLKYNEFDEQPTKDIQRIQDRTPWSCPRISGHGLFAM